MTALLLLGLLAAPDLEKLAAEYFEAAEPRRAEILGALGDADRLDAAGVKTWQARLAKLMGKGRKLEKRGTNYFYDEEVKRGKYIVSGGGSGTLGLLVGMHGGGVGAGDAGEAASTFGPIASRNRCVGIFPEVLEKTERGWTTSGTEEFVLELIQAAKRTWKIDPDRIYLAGHSMGGYGTWTIGARHADLFAGLAAYAGAPTPYLSGDEIVGIEDGVLPNLLNVPIHVYQSLDDKNVPPGPNIYAAAELLRLQKQYGGFPHIYEQVDGRGHGAPPGGHGKAFEWVASHARHARPRHLLWQPVLSWKRAFYWLWWDPPTPRVLLEAKVEEGNVIRISLGGGSIAGLRVLLDEALVDLSREVVIFVDGSEAFRGHVPFTLSTLLMTAAERRDPRLMFPARVDLR
ncbi:MAG: prolyl oligopeptidase family serine peptidase [Planctomycetaceae bacterium]